MSSNMSLTVSPFLSVQNSDRTTAPENITSSTEPQGPNPNSTRTSTLLHISFNQDKSCFAIGTDNGFRIYSCDPFREILRPDVALGGIGQVQLLFRSTILALVGGGSEPHYSPYKVMIWDNHRLGCICELSFRSIVKGVRLRRDRIVVVLVQKVSVYNFVDLKLLDQIETIENPKGLCEISQSSNVNYVLVCPGIQKGQVRVEHYGPKRTKFIMAHDSSLACFALTPDGRVLATASGKGTLVRVFNALDGSLLQEVRRGSGRAEIYSLAFSSTAQWLAVSSDKGTVHIFSLKDETVSFENEKLPSNSGPYASNVSALSSFSVIKGVLPRYFSSEWSMAQIHLQEGLEYHVAFGHKKNTIIILGVDGSFYRCEFDPVKGGEMTKLESHNFLDPEENTM